VLEAYDLRDPSQYRGASNYDYDREFREGNLGGVNESEDDDSLDANCDAENMHEASEEEDCNESLVDSDECGRNDGSDADVLLNVDLEDQIPTHINADAEDDDGNPIKNVWRKMYQNGNT